jgi:hypothetical protein
MIKILGTLIIIIIFFCKKKVFFLYLRFQSKMEFNSSSPMNDSASQTLDDSCAGSSEEDYSFYDTFSWWTDGVLLVSLSSIEVLSY